MKLKTLLFMSAAAPLLLGCDLLNGSGSVTRSSQSSMRAAAMYEPVYNDTTNTNVSAIDGTGYAAFLGKQDGTLSQVFVRMNDDRTIAYVSIDGGDEVEYATRTSYYTNGSSYFNGRWENDEGQTIYVTPNGDYASYTEAHDGSVLSRGYGGIETLPENLPSGEAVYSGNYNTNGDLYLYGQFSMGVDFADSDISGVFGAGYRSSGDTFGTIDGEVSGGRVAGTFFADGRYKGELDFQGAFFGDNGNQVAGGIAGTLTDSEDAEFSTGGNFYGNQRTGFEED